MPEDFRRGQAARVGVSATMHHGRLCQSCEVVATLWMRVSAGNCSKRFHRLLSCLRIVLRTFSLTHSRNYKQKLLRLSREREREREKDFNRHHLGCKMLQACPGAITFLQVSLPDQQAHLVTGQLAGDGILRL